jgi:CubicO group peptidase (beta-lactamase class C family)
VTAALGALTGWPAVATAGVCVRNRGVVEYAGPERRAFPWASVTKILTALAVWVAVEEGTVSWEDAAGPPGATLAHLLAHASGLAPDDDRVLARPGARRIYSNRGFDVAAAHVAERAGMPFPTYLAAAVTEPLGMKETGLPGSAAAGASGPLHDLLRLGAELLRPTLISAETADRVTSVAFPGLAGVLPGFGRQDPNDSGLGLEIRDHKDPHWTGGTNSPETFGHFGQSGSFLWVDPLAHVALACLGDRPFGPWAAKAWPALSDTVIAVHGDA